MYHKHARDEHRDFYILLHCSPDSALAQGLAHMERRLSVPVGSQQDVNAPMGNLHDLVLGWYIDNWRPYLRYIGDKLEKLVSYYIPTPTSHHHSRSFYSPVHVPLE